MQNNSQTDTHAAKVLEQNSVAESRKTRRKSVRLLLRIYVVSLIASALIIGGVLWFAARQLDEEAVETARHLAGSAITGEREALEKLVRDYAYWSDTLENAVISPDVEWADENIGSYLNESFGVSSSYVLNGKDLTTLAFIEGEHVPDIDFWSRFPTSFEPLVTTTRQTEGLIPTPASALVKSGDELHIVAVSRITDDVPSDRKLPPEEREPVLILTRHLDSALLKTISQRFRLPELKLVSSELPGANGHWPLLGSTKQQLGVLQWQQSAPGRGMLKQSIPFIAVVFICAAFLAIWFYQRANRVWRWELNLVSRLAQEEEKNRSKSELMGLISHELRTPLNAIVGISQVLTEEAREDGDDDLVDALIRIQLAGEKLAGIVDRVMEISRLEAGEEGLNISRIQLMHLLDEIVEGKRSLAETSGNTLELKYGQIPDVIETDVEKLKKIVDLLLNNACKFTDKGSILLSVDKVSDTDEWLRIGVTDTGIGIEPDKIKQIFHPFEQGDKRVHRSYEGLGLGLALCHKMADLLGANIDVQSTPGKGSSFYLYLPVNGETKQVKSA